MRQLLDSTNGTGREVWFSQAIHEETYCGPDFLEAGGQAQSWAEGSARVGLVDQP
jgi:hypothetical protein